MMTSIMQRMVNLNKFCISHTNGKFFLNKVSFSSNKILIFFKVSSSCVFLL